MPASLPMYDLPNLRAATDRWWLGVAQAVARRGFGPVPLGLDRSDPPGSVWRRRDLVLSQCCGRDLVTHLAGPVAPVAIPSYRAVGCSAGTYRSWLVARRGDARRNLDAFLGATAAVNYTGSHSGWVALGHALACAGLPERFFGRAVCTGGHRASLQAVVRRVGRSRRDRLRQLCAARAGRAGGDRRCADRGRKRACPGAALRHRRRPSGRSPNPAAGSAHGRGERSQPRYRPWRSAAGSFLPIEGDPYARSIAMAETAAGHLQALADALAMTARAISR